MKKTFFLTICLLVTSLVAVNAQVGINTEYPLATLDINGNLRIRYVDECMGETCGDSILVTNNEGYVQSISKKKLIDSHYKTFVSGTGSSSVILALMDITASWRKIQFDNLMIDENSDFDISTNTFTAPNDGIYMVYVQYQTSALVSGEDLGLGIFVTKTGGTPALVAEETYMNVNVLGVAVSPCTRRTQTLIALDAGDEIFFGAKSLTVLTLNSGSNTFFNIQQVK